MKCYFDCCDIKINSWNFSDYSKHHVL
jgi:hypothetical protein